MMIKDSFSTFSTPRNSIELKLVRPDVYFKVKVKVKVKVFISLILQTIVIAP